MGARQAPMLHGWIYGLQDGAIHDLGVSPQADGEVETLYGEAIATLGRAGDEDGARARAGSPLPA